MKFYDREKDVSYLRDIRLKSETNARFTVITGRRRVGKTQLVQQAMGDRPYLYFYVGRKSEKELLLMSMIDIALRLSKESTKNDATPFVKLIEKLTAEVEETLK